MEEELNIKRETLYDVIYLKEIANGFAIDPIPMLCCVDYQTALEKKTELDKVYNPDYIVIWKNVEKSVIGRT
jgi:hypothetical protein